jgi:membrane peptidoglycan carboxypeptidase
LIRKALLLFAALVILYAAYLGVRVWQERGLVAAKVDRIIAGADPQELALSPARQAMILKVEDPTFWTNKGIDLSSPGAGMTTLSQGLGKRLFFDDFEPGFAKGELMALTRFALYPKVSKQRTLQALIASAYLGTHRGRPVTGFADGARTWFGKPLAGLSDEEFLNLEAMLIAPDSLKPGRDDAGRAERVSRIKRLLAGTCKPGGLRDAMLNGCKA